MHATTLVTTLTTILALLAFPAVSKADAPPNLWEAFDHASEVVLYQTAASASQQASFSKETVREHATFVSMTVCRDCEIAGSGLLKELSAARRMRGECLRPTSVIDLRRADHATIAAIYFGNAGKCFEFEGRSYALNSSSLSKKLAALSFAVQ